MSVNLFKNGKLHKIAGNTQKIDVTETPISFTEAETRENMESGNNIPTAFGKIQKWLSDLKPVAFSGKLEATDRTAESPLILKKGYGVGGLHGDGTENAKWYNFARIIYREESIDYPIELVVGRRGSKALNHLTIMLQGGTGNRSMGTFSYSGDPNITFYGHIVNDTENDTTVNLYISGGQWDNIWLHDVKINTGLMPDTRITQPGVFFPALPSGGIYASFYNPPSGMGWKLLQTVDIKQADGTVYVNYGSLDPQPKEFCIRYGGKNGEHIYGGGSITTPNSGADPFMLPLYRGTTYLGIVYIFVYSGDIRRVELAFTDTTSNPQTVKFRVFYR